MKIGLLTYSRLPHLSEDDRLLQQELVRAGTDAMPVVWDDASVDWTRFDAVVIRSCWDYHTRPAQFSRWFDESDGEGVELLEPALFLAYGGRAAEQLSMVILTHVENRKPRVQTSR